MKSFRIRKFLTFFCFLAGLSWLCSTALAADSALVPLDFDNGRKIPLILIHGIHAAGFVQDKQEFYANLTDILEIRSMSIERDARDLSDSLGVLNRRVGLPSFDRDAVSLLTIPIGHLEELIERIAAFADRNLK